MAYGTRRFNAAYILILPGFGIISGINCHERGGKDAFGNLEIIFAIFLTLESPYKDMSENPSFLKNTRTPLLDIISFWVL